MKLIPKFLERNPPMNPPESCEYVSDRMALFSVSLKKKEIMEQHCHLHVQEEVTEGSAERGDSTVGNYHVSSIITNNEPKKGQKLGLKFAEITENLSNQSGYETKISTGGVEGGAFMDPKAEKASGEIYGTTPSGTPIVTKSMDKPSKTSVKKVTNNNRRKFNKKISPKKPNVNPELKKIFERIKKKQEERKLKDIEERKLRLEEERKLNLNDEKKIKIDEENSSYMKKENSEVKERNEINEEIRKD